MMEKKAGKRERMTTSKRKTSESTLKIHGVVFIVKKLLEN